MSGCACMVSNLSATSVTGISAGNSRFINSCNAASVIESPFLVKYPFGSFLARRDSGKSNPPVQKTPAFPRMHCRFDCGKIPPMPSLQCRFSARRLLLPAPAANQCLASAVPVQLRYDRCRLVCRHFRPKSPQ